MLAHYRTKRTAETWRRYGCWFHTVTPVGISKATVRKSSVASFR
jgi:hypothetical protein